MRTLAILTSVVGLLFAYQAHSQVQCSDLFHQSRSSSTISKEAIQNALTEGKRIFFLEQNRGELNLVIKLGTEKVSVGPLHVLVPKTEVYHWGSVHEHRSLVANGVLKQDSIVRRINGRDRAGGGFYVSLSPIDAKHFGSHLTVSIFQEPVLEIPRAVYSKILRLSGLEDIPLENIEHVSKLRAALNLAFIDLRIGAIEIASTWKVLLHESSLTQLKTPTADQVFVALQRLEPASPRVVQVFTQQEVPSYLKAVQNSFR